MARLAARSLIALLVAGLIAIPAWNANPPPVGSPTGDALLFLSTAQHINVTGEFINRFYSPLPANGPVFNWHGWLQPWLTAALAPEPTWRSLLRAQGLLSSLVALAFAVALLGTSVRPMLKAALFMIGLVPIAAYSARPETLACGLLILWWLADGAIRVARLPSRRLTLAVLMLGLLGITQPTVALLAGLFVIAYGIERYPQQRLALPALLGAGSAAIALFLTQCLHPAGALAWIQGLYQHATLVANRVDGAFVHYFLLNTSNLGVGLNLLGLFSLVLWLAAVTRWRVEAKIFLGLAVLAGWFLGVRTPVTHFNITAFLPIAALAVAQGLDARRLDSNPLIFALIIAMAAAPSLSASKLLVTHALTHSPQAVNYPMVQQRAARLLEEYPRVALPGAAVTLTDSLDAVSDPRLMDNRLTNGEDAVLLLQAHSGRATPPTLENYRLCENHFNRTPNRWLGLAFSSTAWGWDYAVYVRESLACPN